MIYYHEERKRERFNKAGFSLIELVIAITIGAMIVGASLYFATTYFESAKRSTTRTTLQHLKVQLEMYKGEKGSFPESLAQLQKSGFWKAKALPKDGWDRSFVYRLTPDAKNPYELFSYGPEGKGSPKESRIDVLDVQ
jgi:prepilin-type N-terminal cleavage/methylation domain-containing protein